jgi:hypothetical protein
MLDNVYSKYGTNNHKSLINLLRRKYNNIEEAYLAEGGISKKCNYCDNASIFLSFFKGYSHRCDSLTCRKKHFSKAVSGQNKIKYKEKKCIICSNEFISNEKDKRPICNDSKCNLIKKSFLFLKEENDIITKDVMSNKSTLNKAVYNLRLKYKNILSVGRIIKRNLILNGYTLSYKDFLKRNYLYHLLNENYEINDFVLTKDEKYYINFKFTYITKLINDLYGDSLIEYLTKFYPDNVKTCEICNSFYMIKSIPYYKKKNTSLYTCSIKCYRLNYKRYVTPERKIKQSNTLKRKIASGEFTPCVTNSWAKSRCEVIIDNKTITCRSSWDAYFQIHNPTLKYEFIRIPYISNNKKHSYIVDFVDLDKKIIYEIKPSIYLNDNLNKIKIESANKWAINNNYAFNIIDDNWFIKNYDETLLKDQPNEIKIKRLLKQFKNEN